MSPAALLAEYESAFAELRTWMLYGRANSERAEALRARLWELWPLLVLA